MSTSRPFAYNPSTPISGTDQYGNLAVGVSDEPYADNYGGVIWWNGPDEDLGYVIAQSVPDNSQPTPILGVFASVGFYRSDVLDEPSFIEIANSVSGQIFTSGNQASAWLTNNGYWSSWPGLTNNIILEGFYFPGSVGAGYLATAEFPVDADVSINFTNILSTTGTPLTITGSVEIYSGLTTGYTQIFVDYNYSALTDESVFTGITFAVTGTTDYGFSGEVSGATFNVTPTPTPSITPSVTPSVTPSITGTNTGVTPTPTVTQTPTSTSLDITPTPTGTPAGVTPTPTATPTMYYYSVNGYSCGVSCTVIGTFVVKSTSPLTIGYFYNNPENRGYSFEILNIIPESSTNYDLTGEPGYADCVVACTPVTPTPTPTSTSLDITPTQTETPASVTPTATGTPEVTPTQTPSVTGTQASVTPTATGTPEVTPTQTETPTLTPTSLPRVWNLYYPCNTTNPATQVIPFNESYLGGEIIKGSNGLCYTIAASGYSLSEQITVDTEFPTCEDCELTLITPTPTETPATPTPTPSVTGTPGSVTPTATGTPEVTPTQTPSVTGTQASVTPTATGTPEVTPTQTETATQTPTPSTSPVPVTGYGYNLVALPYNLPTSGNSIMNAASGTTGSTLINELTITNRGFYFNSIDSIGVDRTSYFSQFTGQSVTITFTQNGDSAIYSGDTSAFKSTTFTGGTGFVFGTEINVGSGASGNAVIIQSASTTWVTGATVYVSAVNNNPSVTPTPTATSVTPTPTPTSGYTSDGWLFYSPNNSPVLAPPNSSGNTAFIDTATGFGTYNPNYTGGTFNLYFNNITSNGTSYVSQFSTLDTAGGTITISQGSSTAIYSGSPANYQSVSSYLILTVNNSAQMIQSASTPFVSGTSINVVVS